MKTCCVYLSSPVNALLSTKQKRFDMLCLSIKNTSKIFNNKDYIIFHEDFQENHINKILEINKKCKFVKLDFERKELDFKKYGRPKGYMLMCRFFSGELQKYLIDNNYDSYIRFDDDSFLIEPSINLNTFEDEMKENDYITRTLFYDNQSKYEDKPMQKLFEFTKNFIIENGFSYNKILPKLININFVNKNEQYTGLAPYNNFHYSKLSLWKNNLIEKYVNKLLECNGCLMNFWMDANVHAMIIFMLLPLVNKKLYFKTDFGYRHNRHFSILNSLNLRYKSNESFYPE
tara:strand:- start:215 stop:1078 length:864 start_codon:yes stop_codon:yes gene_type:complete